MNTKLSIHEKEWGIYLALGLLLLSIILMITSGILQTNNIITKDQGEIGLIFTFISFIGSMYCLIA
jgi:hypothetical protein